jgi:hypothetical protein
MNSLLKKENIQPQYAATLSLGVFVAWMLFVYALSYRPFITEAYLPPLARISIEGFILSILLAINLKYNYMKWAIWCIPFFIISASTILLELDTFLKLAFSFNKMLFLVLAIGLFCGNRSILDTCVKLWVKLWSFLAIMAILAFAGYFVGIIHFSPMNFSESLGYDPGRLHFLHNFIFGNLSPRTAFGMHVGRVSGYMFEPGLLAFFFGFNILVAKKLIANQKSARNFIWLNLIAGLTTISYTFIFFMGVYFLGKQLIGVAKMSAISILLLPLAVFFVFYGIDLNILEQTSGSARIAGFLLSWRIAEDNTWLTFLLGNGVGISKELYGSGIDSAWVGLFIERGIIILIFMLSLLYKLTKENLWLMFYVFCYYFAFNTLWDPIFLLGIAIQVALFYQNKKCWRLIKCNDGYLLEPRKQMTYDF